MRGCTLQPPVRRVLERERGTGGAGPRSYEARAAFLMLFGETHHLKLAGGLSVAATVAGVKGREVLVQRLGADEQGLEKREADGSEDYRVRSRSRVKLVAGQNPAWCLGMC